MAVGGGGLGGGAHEAFLNDRDGGVGVNELSIDIAALFRGSSNFSFVFFSEFKNFGGSDGRGGADFCVPVLLPRSSIRIDLEKSS